MRAEPSRSKPSRAELKIFRLGLICFNAAYLLCSTHGLTQCSKVYILFEVACLFFMSFHQIFMNNSHHQNFVLLLHKNENDPLKITSSQYVLQNLIDLLYQVCNSIRLYALPYA